MNEEHTRWSAADAKAGLSRVVEKAQKRVQIIERHGKPAAAVIGWECFRRHRREIEELMGEWLDELAEINETEEQMEEIVRSDRPLPEDIGS